MTPEQALAEIQSGTIRPVYLVVGEEQHLASRVVRALHEKVAAGGVAGLNDDSLTAPGDRVDQLISLCRTLPMLAQRRWVLARAIDKWDSDKTKSPKKAGRKSAAEAPLDQLATFLESPPETTVLVLVAEKLDKRRRLYTAAKKGGYLVSCEPLKRGEIPAFIREEVVRRGCTIARDSAELLAETAGTDLSTLTDAVERLCLFVGDGQEVSEAAISELVVRVRTATVWELVSAVGDRDADRALRLLADVYDPSDRGLRLVGVLAWAGRQLLKFDRAVQEGLSPQDAAKAAGAPPFKARELQGQLKKLGPEQLTRWFLSLEEADFALKGGSKRPPNAILERMVLDLCLSS